MESPSNLEDEQPQSGKTCGSAGVEIMTYYSCFQCGKKFKREVNFKAHLKTHETPKFKCCWCNRQFVRQHTLINHICFAPKKKPFSCILCQESFVCKRTYKMHMRSHDVHMLETNSRNSAPKSNMEDPVRIHEDSFQCRLCDLFFTSAYKFVRHMHFHNVKKPFLCRVCKCIFDSVDDLFLHKLCECEKKACDSCECDWCGKEFEDYRQLVRHISVYKEKGVTCWICKQNFCGKKDRNNHMMTHLKGSLDQPSELSDIELVPHLEAKEDFRMNFSNERNQMSEKRISSNLGEIRNQSGMKRAKDMYSCTVDLVDIGKIMSGAKSIKATNKNILATQKVLSEDDHKIIKLNKVIGDQPNCPKTLPQKVRVVNKNILAYEKDLSEDKHKIVKFSRVRGDQLNCLKTSPPKVRVLPSCSTNIKKNNLQTNSAGRRLVPILPKPQNSSEAKNFTQQQNEGHTNPDRECLINIKRIDVRNDTLPTTDGNVFTLGQGSDVQETSNIVLLPVAQTPLNNSVYLTIAGGKILALQNNGAQNLTNVSTTPSNPVNMPSTTVDASIDKKKSQPNASNVMNAQNVQKICSGNDDSKVVSLRRGRMENGQHCVKMSIKNQVDENWEEKTVIPTEQSINLENQLVRLAKNDMTISINKRDGEKAPNQYKERNMQLPETSSCVRKTSFQTNNNAIIKTIDKKIIKGSPTGDFIKKIPSVSPTPGKVLLLKRKVKHEDVGNNVPSKVGKREEQGCCMFQCTFCDRSFKSLNSYENHRLLHIKNRHIERIGLGSKLLKKRKDLQVNVTENYKSMPLSNPQSKNNLKIHLVTQSGKDSLTCSKCGQKVQLQHKVQDYVGSHQGTSDDGEEMVYISRFPRPEGNIRRKAIFQCHCDQDISTVVDKNKGVPDSRSATGTMADNSEVIGKNANGSLMRNSDVLPNTTNSTLTENSIFLVNNIKKEPEDNVVNVKKELDDYDFTGFEVWDFPSQETTREINKEILDNVKCEIIEDTDVVIKEEHDPSW